MQLSASLLAALGLLNAVHRVQATCGTCTACDNTLRNRVGNVDSGTCPEGQVATVVQLMSSASTGKYKVSIESLSGYVYHSSPNASTCYDASSFGTASLPVIGDQRTIRVQFSCSSLTCTIAWNVTFGCIDTGITVANGGLQVVSDIDDTLVCPDPECDTSASCIIKGQLMRYLAGRDRSLDSKERYPGAAELYLALALGPNRGPYPSAAVPETVPAKPILWSARPRELEFMLGLTQDHILNKWMVAVGLSWDYPSWGVNVDQCIYGTILDGLSFKEFGSTKAKSFQELSSKNPLTRYAYVGDNGQGDVCAAQAILQGNRSGSVAAVLIHVTVDPAQAIQSCYPAAGPLGGSFSLNLPESDKVHYFDTHSNATLWTLQRGLISCCSARAVYEAIQNFRACRCRAVGALEPSSGCSLPTVDGPASPADRNATIAFCDKLVPDQALLFAAVESCDPNQRCPRSSTRSMHMEEVPSAAFASAWPSASLAFLLLLTLGSSQAL